ncbi:hypothetical protein QJQ45_000136 [Haematococcus lacustris]|nr:hypothetical protein QJQ45_000136 [Haematococcus lacustris]
MDSAKLSFLGDKVRSVAERSRNRGGMLVQLIAGMQRVDRAKQALEAAKAELDAAETELADKLQQVGGCALLHTEDCWLSSRAMLKRRSLQAVAQVAAEDAPAQGVAVATAAAGAEPSRPIPPVGGSSKAPPSAAAGKSAPGARAAGEDGKGHDAAPAAYATEAAPGDSLRRSEQHELAEAPGSAAARLAASGKFRISLDRK